MELSGEVDRALAVHRVPARRVGRAEELGLQADPGEGLFHREPLDPGGGVPGGPARGAAQHMDLGYAALFQADPEDR